MDAASAFLSIFTLLASVLALAVSVAVATRQNRLAWGGNHGPLIANYLGEARARIWRDERALLAWLAENPATAADQGFAALPKEFQDKAYNVCMYYQSIAYLVFYRIFDEELAFQYFHFSSARTFAVLQPYIYSERLIRGDDFSFFNAYEELVLLFRTKNAGVAFEKMMWRYKRYRRKAPARAQ